MEVCVALLRWFASHELEHLVSASVNVLFRKMKRIICSVKLIMKNIFSGKTYVRYLVSESAVKAWKGMKHKLKDLCFPLPRRKLQSLLCSKVLISLINLFEDFIIFSDFFSRVQNTAQTGCCSETEQNCKKHGISIGCVSF